MTSFRQRLLLLGLLLVALVPALVFLFQGSGGPEPEALPAAGASEATDAGTGGGISAPSGRAEEVPAPGPREAPLPQDPEEQLPGTGTIEGQIALAAGVATRISDFTIQVAEAVNPQAAAGAAKVPFSVFRTFKYEPGQGTPRFFMAGIPFSEYGYRVSVHVPGQNGSDQHATVSAERPHASVVLLLRPPAQITIMLRDQDRNPVPDLGVHMVPVGFPPGRTSHYGTADNYGCVLFEQVLRGRYSVHVGPPGAPVVREEAEVQPEGIQIKTVTVPRGTTVTFLVGAPGGHGLEGVTVEAIAVDAVQWKRIPGTTDRAGRVEFAHLTPGQYQVSFEKRGFARNTQRVLVTAEPMRAPIQVELTPTW